MYKHPITNDELISAIRGLNIKEFSIRELEYLSDLFQLKSRQLDEEVRRRKREGED